MASPRALPPPVGKFKGIDAFWHRSTIAIVDQLHQLSDEPNITHPTQPLRTRMVTPKMKNCSGPELNWLQGKPLFTTIHLQKVAASSRSALQLAVASNSYSLRATPSLVTFYSPYKQHQKTDYAYYEAYLADGGSQHSQFLLQSRHDRASRGRADHSSTEPDSSSVIQDSGVKPGLPCCPLPLAHLQRRVADFPNHQRHGASPLAVFAHGDDQHAPTALRDLARGEAIGRCGGLCCSNPSLQPAVHN